MKAVRMHRYGGPDVLRYEDAPRPEPGPGEVLVRVHAAGVNPVDWKAREGQLQPIVRHRLPLILGWDLSGTVEAVGPGVEAFRPGDEVYGRSDVARDGAYAEYAVVRASELARKPRGVDHVHAAAVPLAALTAWQALVESPASGSSLAVSRGQTVLIHGAAGGVGHFAVQLAKWRGARVIATGSARNEEFLRRLGADEFVDYTRYRFEEVVSDVDAVLDTVGLDTQVRSWSVVKPGGALASLIGPPSAVAARSHGARAVFVNVQSSVGQLDALARLIDEGILRPHVSEVFPLAEARRSHELSAAGHVRGKLVLSVA